MQYFQLEIRDQFRSSIWTLHAQHLTYPRKVATQFHQYFPSSLGKRLVQNYVAILSLLSHGGTFGHLAQEVRIQAQRVKKFSFVLSSKAYNVLLKCMFAARDHSSQAFMLGMLFFWSLLLRTILMLCFCCSVFNSYIFHTFWEQDIFIKIRS